jgi:hypothetical protein
MSGAVVVLMLLVAAILPTLTDASPLFSFPLLSKEPLEIAPPIRGQDYKLGDGDVVGRKVYIYKCKICDMPRIFVMNYGSFIF